MAELPKKFSMKEIKRDLYLNRLVKAKHDGLIKVISGLRRVGKSYLLNHIFYNHLIESGVKKENIITFSFDDILDIQKLNDFRKEESTIINTKDGKKINAFKFTEYLFSLIKEDGENYYLLLDEIQLLDNFELCLNGYLKRERIDVYVTGSNSHFLTSDIITEFRGRSTNIYLLPLTFKECYPYLNNDKQLALNDYLLYGGLPLTVSKKTSEEKAKYLDDLFDTVYLKDVIDRHKLERKDALDEILNLLSSNISSLTNPKKICDTFVSKGEKEISINTVTNYLLFLEESYLIKKVNRFDIRGKNYLSSTVKYFFTDLGLRNARLNFKNNDIDRMLENIVYNELIYRGFSVDVGVIENRENNLRKQLEVNFVANSGNKRYYIQVTLSIFDNIKRDLEKKSLVKIKDSYKKILIVYDYIKMYRDENGFLIISIYDFLLNDNSLDF